MGGPKVGGYSDGGILTIRVASLNLGLCKAMFTGTNVKGYLTVRPEHSDSNKKHTEMCPGGEVEGSVKFRVRCCVFEKVVPAFLEGPSGLSRAF